MLSGTPIISTRLNGFSKEYNDLIYFSENNQVDELIKIIKTVMEEPYSKCIETARKARDYVINSKTWDKQVARIIDFMVG